AACGFARGCKAASGASVVELELAGVDEHPQEVAEPLTQRRSSGNPFLRAGLFLRPRRTRERREVELFDHRVERRLRFQQRLETARRGGDLAIEEVAIEQVQRLSNVRRRGPLALAGDLTRRPAEDVEQERTH